MTATSFTPRMPAALVVITQMHPISVLFTLPEQTLSEIQKQDHGAGFESAGRDG